MTSNLIWPPALLLIIPLISHSIGGMNSRRSVLMSCAYAESSCIVSNEIAKTPEKDEGKDDKDNEIDQWKSN